MNGCTVLGQCLCKPLSCLQNQSVVNGYLWFLGFSSLLWCLFWWTCPAARSSTTEVCVAQGSTPLSGLLVFVPKITLGVFLKSCLCISVALIPLVLKQL